MAIYSLITGGDACLTKNLTQEHGFVGLACVVTGDLAHQRVIHETESENLLCIQTDRKQ